MTTPATRYPMTALTPKRRKRGTTTIAASRKTIASRSIEEPNPFSRPGVFCSLHPISWQSPGQNDGQPLPQAVCIGLSEATAGNGAERSLSFVTSLWSGSKSMACPALDILDDVPCHAAGCAGIVLMLWNCDRHDLP